MIQRAKVAAALIGMGSILVFPCFAAPARDGSHDFDFSKGVWHTHATKILDPFDGGTHTLVFDGTKTAKPIWGGKGWVEEIEADSAKGHWEGMTLFVYNSEAGQWSQTYVDGGGRIDEPTIGSFREGVGRFYGSEKFDGRTVLVKGEWSMITATSHHFEISYSDDGGTTWFPAFKADLTR